MYKTGIRARAAGYSTRPGFRGTEILATEMDANCQMDSLLMADDSRSDGYITKSRGPYVVAWTPDSKDSENQPTKDQEKHLHPH